MKKTILIYLFLCCAFFSFESTKAQTLQAGDIAFVGLDFAGSDGFSFIALKPLPAGETLYFAEEGWHTGNVWNTLETHLQWTIPAGGIACGTIISIVETAVDTFTITGATGAVTYGYKPAGPGFQLGGSGDQILAYQSATGVRPTNPTFIAGVHAEADAVNYNDSTKWSTQAVAGSESIVPLGLTNGVDCISLFSKGQPTEPGYNKYTGTLTGTAAAIRASINNVANWGNSTTATLGILPSNYATPVINCAVATTPTVTTTTATGVGAVKATMGGNVTADAGAAVTERGIVWATTANPTTANTKITNGTGTGVFSGLVSSLPAGTTVNYRAYAINSGGTSYGANLSFTTGAALSAITNKTNVTCNGGSNGTAWVTASGGAPPYSYLWSSGGTGATATGLTAGPYTCTITDSELTQFTTGSIAVSQTPPLNASISSTIATCNGGSNGTATVVDPTNVTGPFSYLWSTGATGTTASGLAAGPYTCRITAPNTCSIIKNFNITQPPAITATTTQTSVSCNGGSNGTATVVGATGGTGTLTYSWNTNPVQTTATATGLAASATPYVCTITDINLCSITKNVTIIEPQAIITSITGANAICLGSTTTLSPTTGGTWASSNTAVATVTDAGVVTGVSNGTATFTFTQTSTGCPSAPTAAVTVNANPTASITGANPICVGVTSALSPTTGGTWASSNTAVATVTDAGVVTGVSNGTATFTFTQTSTGCPSAPTAAITVNALPITTILGANAICVGSTTTLSPTTGGTWMSSNTAIAPVTNGGTTIGVTNGIATFIFRLNSTGCSSAPTAAITVKALPTTTILGANAICVGSTTTLSPTTGGTWASSSAAVATVTNAGVVTGVSNGSATFTFTQTSTGCPSSPTAAITVNALPTTTILGANAICMGSTTTLSPTTGGTWASSNTAVATVTDAGLVTGVSDGSATFTFTKTSTGCVSAPTAAITVNALPTANITGTNAICIGSTTTLSPTTGGTWMSSNTAIAPVTNAGTIIGVTNGSATFIYTQTSTGCVSAPTAAVTVNALPTANITGTNTICVNGTSTLSPTTGGTWTSSNTAVATVTDAGLVTGVSNGSATFTFTQTSTGCNSAPTAAITVNALPIATISGTNAICVGSTTTLSPTTGGTWMSSNTAIAPVTNAGTVIGVTNGSATFIYTQTNTGCVSDPTAAVTVNALPTATITSTNLICVGTTSTVLPNTGGTWASSNNSVATVTNAGLVTGVANGSATFTFTQTNTGCVSDPTDAVTVNALPAATITGSNPICVGSTSALSPTTGGIWASSNTAVATVTNAGVVTGVSNGSATFTFTKTSTGCVSDPTAAVTVNETAAPTATATQPFCSSAIVADLVATGTDTKWYDATNNGNLLTSSTVLVSGNKYYVSQTLNSCESIRTEVSVSITVINKTITQTGNTLMANQTGASYQWFKCPSELLSVETNQSITPTSTGSYAVGISLNGCLATSDCVTVTILGKDIFEKEEVLTIYPNPNKGILNIKSDFEGVFIITDQLGKTVKTFKVLNSDYNSINIESLSDGAYYLRATNGTKIVSKKLIIKK
ncbi:T9SS type A sorting domain-containing protein [Flavobacterium sp. ZT3R18]|uniref:Ig-like domain-containing protein n=1 Tax=Flavobacterium sp. ZT3R18 TaxID=2594429 RepID=UPI00117AA560|nr:Ig-like domain-containing protein [Flavobacterium sp. ZT3R18]TRX36409.1 T9SS type A sorting domain-containing protein [Flavobacterium sp. ZT3R18]